MGPALKAGPFSTPDTEAEHMQVRSIIAGAATAALLLGGGFGLAQTLDADTGPSYLQASSTEDQFGGGPVTINSLDGAGGALWLDENEIVIDESGVYTFIAAPQVGGVDTPAKSGELRLWFEVDPGDGLGFRTVPNSNVLWSSQQAKDGTVLVSQGVGFASAGSRVRLVWRTTGPNLEAIERPEEPVIPSIIVSAFQVG